MTEIQTYYLERPSKLLNLFKTGVLQDTKVLILYVIGAFDLRTKTRYLNKFDLNSYDYDTFIRFKEQMKINTFVVTPNILTEFFNHIENKLGHWFFKKNMDELKPFIDSLSEEYCNKDSITTLPKFGEFDFTDLSIYLTSKKDNYHILTYDFSLSQYCKSSKNKDTLVIHFPEIINLRALTSR